MFRAKSIEEHRIGPGGGQIFLRVTDSTGPQPAKQFKGLAKAALLFKRLNRLWVAVELESEHTVFTLMIFFVD
jgi:hypothetical protein